MRKRWFDHVLSVPIMYPDIYCAGAKAHIILTHLRHDFAAFGSLRKLRVTSG